MTDSLHPARSLSTVSILDAAGMTECARILTKTSRNHNLLLVYAGWLCDAVIPYVDRWVYHDAYYCISEMVKELQNHHHTDFQMLAHRISEVSRLEEFTQPNSEPIKSWAEYVIIASSYFVTSAFDKRTDFIFFGTEHYFVNALRTMIMVGETLWASSLIVEEMNLAFRELLSTRNILCLKKHKLSLPAVIV